MPRGAAYRQRIREEWRDTLARRLGATELAQRVGRSGGEHGAVAAPAGSREGAPDRMALGARTFRQSDERPGGPVGDQGTRSRIPYAAPGRGAGDVSASIRLIAASRRA